MLRLDRGEPKKQKVYRTVEEAVLDKWGPKAMEVDLDGSEKKKTKVVKKVVKKKVVKKKQPEAEEAEAAAA